VKHANNGGEMMAMPGTVCGETGWYQFNFTVYYFEVTEDGEFEMYGTPVEELKWRQLRAKGFIAGNSKLTIQKDTLDFESSTKECVGNQQWKKLRLMFAATVRLKDIPINQIIMVDAPNTPESPELVPSSKRGTNSATMERDEQANANKATAPSCKEPAMGRGKKRWTVMKLMFDATSKVKTPPKTSIPVDEKERVNSKSESVLTRSSSSSSLTQPRGSTHMTSLHEIVLVTRIQVRVLGSDDISTKT
jgi:hypothetical protein